MIRRMAFAFERLIVYQNSGTLAVADCR